jgi:hypothetical protein
MAASEIYSLLHIINFQRLEVDGIMRTHTQSGARARILYFRKIQYLSVSK